VNAATITWKETLRRLARDRDRISGMLDAKFDAPPRLLALQPSYLCVLLHRMAHYFWCRGNGKLARAFTQANSLFTGADIHPHCDFGWGVLIPHPVALTASGNAGENCTLMPLSGIGILPRDKDIGAGPGLPILGDDVWLGAGCGVLGPV
jgi:serine O-acetyltransferase